MPPMPRIGHVGQRLVHLPDAAHRDRPDRRPGQAAGDAAEHRPQRVGVDDHAQQRVDDRQAVGAGVDAGPRDRGDVGDVRRQLGEDRDAGAVLRRTACDHAAAARGSQAKTWPRSSTLGQRDVDLDHRQARGAAQLRAPAGRSRRRCRRRSTRPPARPAVGQPRQVLVEERVDAGALQADGVEHPARRLGHPRRRPAGARRQHDRLGDDPAEAGDVEELVELLARRPRSRWR